MMFLVVKGLSPRKKNVKILAIDADPATSLPPALGISVKKTIGDIREELVQGPGRAPVPDTPLDILLENKISDIT